MTATVVDRDTWWDANGDLIRLVSGHEGGRWVPRHDAALAILLGGPADGRGAVMIRGAKPPAIVGKRLAGPFVLGARPIAWYRRDDGPSKLTYRFMYTSPSWPAGGAR